MVFAVYGVFSILICWKLGDWKNWQKYYPTILYFIIGNLVYEFLFYMHPLWAFSGVFGGYPPLTIAVMCLAYPVTTILFLAHYPTQPRDQILYIVLWATMFAVLELMDELLFGFKQMNSWAYTYTYAFDIIMFFLLRLHYKKPLLVWPISAALAFLMLWWFNAPLMK